MMVSIKVRGREREFNSKSRWGEAKEAIRVFLVKGGRVQKEPGMIMRVHIKAINVTT